MIVNVPKADFKRAIKDLAPLFRFSEQFRAFNLSIKGGVLYINANTGLCYETAIPLKEEYNDFEINLIYQDISEILGEKGDVELNLSPASCTVSSGAFEVTLSPANDSVTPLYHSKTEESQLPEFFQYVCKTLTNTLTFRKAYKLSPILTFNGKVSYVKFPTVWVETMNGYLHCNLTMDIADIVLNFEPTSYTEKEDRIFLYRGDTVLVVPCSTPSENNFDKMVQGMIKVTELDVANLAVLLRKVAKVFGNGGATMFLAERGFRLQVMRPGAHSFVNFGDTGAIKASAQLPLEFILAVFNILGGRVNIYFGGGKICLQNSTTRILLSVNG